jgi:hypothetical protein
VLVAGLLAVPAQVTVKGTGTDSKGGGQPGVSIVVKGITSTSDGSYALALLTPAATLIFSFVGYGTTERQANGQTFLNVRLEDQKALDEVVVMGYGTIKKSDLTGSVTTVKTRALVSSGMLAKDA